MLIREDFYATCCRVAMQHNGKRCPVCRTNLPYREKVGNLRPGDCVKVLDGGAYSVGTVKHVVMKDKGIVDSVIVVRPYIHTSDVMYSNGLITYTGLEEFRLWPHTDVLVLEETRVSEVLQTESDEGRRLRAGR